jgi:cytochrome c551/c552
MRQCAKAAGFVIAAVTAVLLLTVSMVEFGPSVANATPAIGKGKPCGACHASSSPSKGDVRKKKYKRSKKASAGEPDELLASLREFLEERP